LVRIGWTDHCTREKDDKGGGREWHLVRVEILPSTSSVVGWGKNGAQKTKADREGVVK